MNSQSPSFIHIHHLDNVVVCLRTHRAGETVTFGADRIVVREDIPAGHKLAVGSIAEEAPVMKFGWPIGLASIDIAPGQHVHVHNLRCDHQVDLAAVATECPDTPTLDDEYWFDGYVRPDGSVGTRNYVAVISNVNCSASVARMVANRFDESKLRPFEHVDGVISFRHEGGCAMKWEGTRHRMLSQVLGGIARHPNIGGCLLVGLGCEQATLDHLIDSQRLHQIHLSTTHTTPARRQRRSRRRSRFCRSRARAGLSPRWNAVSSLWRKCSRAWTQRVGKGYRRDILCSQRNAAVRTATLESLRIPRLVLRRICSSLAAVP